MAALGILEQVFKRLKPVLHIRELFSPLRLWRIRRLLCLHTGLKVGECAFDGLLPLGKPHVRTADFAAFEPLECEIGEGCGCVISVESVIFKCAKMSGWKPITHA